MNYRTLRGELIDLDMLQPDDLERYLFIISESGGSILEGRLSRFDTIWALPAAIEARGEFTLRTEEEFLKFTAAVFNPEGIWHWHTMMMAVAKSKAKAHSIDIGEDIVSTPIGKLVTDLMLRAGCLLGQWDWYTVVHDPRLETWLGVKRFFDLNEFASQPDSPMTSVSQIRTFLQSCDRDWKW